jgi:hypothetical protein
MPWNCFHVQLGYLDIHQTNLEGTVTKTKYVPYILPYLIAMPN